MNKNSSKENFIRRSLVLGSCKAILFGCLFSRMFYLQIMNNKKFSKLAEKNRVRAEVIPALRGKILDRNNVSLAINEPSYTLVFEKLKESQLNNQIAIKLGYILNFTSIEQADLITYINEAKPRDLLVIKDNLTWQDLVNIEVNIPDLSGVYIKTGFLRSYPHANIVSHITGYLGSASENEKSTQTTILYPNLKIGKNGFEKTKENFLKGEVGYEKIEVNAKGQIIKKLNAQASIPGSNVNLTIDINLQTKIDQLMGNEVGAIILAKISNGEILASVSKPDFNPNLFSQGISSHNWNQLLNNPELPLINRIVSLTYPPGSGFKINVAIAALTQGFNPERIFTCPGYHMVGERMFRCWKKTGHGAINLYQAIAGSCNVYFWNIARIIGIQPIADIARSLGYGGKLLNNELPREQSGIIPDSAWKKAKIGSDWTLSDTINASIGQGYVEATPIQILTMVARIASGKKVIPSFIKCDSVKNFESLNLDKELGIIKKGMSLVVNSNIGTAYANRILEPNIAMAGKTGTSQVISKRHKDDDLSKENIVKKIRNHGIFVGYAPLIDPQYAFCGIIEHGGFPAKAIRIAREVLTEVQLKKI